MNVDPAGEFRSALMKLKARLDEPGHARQSEAWRHGVTLEQVEAALRRLQEGTYGVCRGCFLVIPRGQLFRRPHAERCDTCQSLRARRQGLKNQRWEVSTPLEV